MTTALEWGEGSSSSPGRSLPPGKGPVPIVQEAGWPPGPVWTGAENLAPTGIRSPDRPDRSQSLFYIYYIRIKLFVKETDLFKNNFKILRHFLTQM
jgi:hypothetical protein